jgi:hypothetical protein
MADEVSTENERPKLSIEGPYETWPCRAPHCDSRILHLASECSYCADAAPLQEERERLGISNSGHANRQYPCPADQARAKTQYSAWPGNRPTK